MRSGTHAVEHHPQQCKNAAVLRTVVYKSAFVTDCDWSWRRLQCEPKK